MDKDFLYKKLTLQDDYEGQVVSTLISSQSNTGNRASVLYLHGYVDYFFHPHMATQFINHNIDFHAIDLRKYGRSLLIHQHPNYCVDMQEYFEEISLAIDELKTKSEGDIYLLGHSTGGLLACNYIKDGRCRGDIKKLILNSPFLKFNNSQLEIVLTKTIARMTSFFMPYANVTGSLPSVYAKSIHKDYYGEWDFNLDFKPIEGFPTYFKWILAVDKAQKKLLNSDIKIPILLLHSSSSKKLKHFSPEAMTSDIVLNINDMKTIGPTLGDNVSLVEVKNAQHDIFLSALKVREKAFVDMFSWLEKS